MTLCRWKEKLPLVAPSIGCVGDPFLNWEGKHDAHTHHDRLYSCASYCRCTFVAARMMRRIVSCETPYASATMRSGSFRSTTRCTTVGQCSAGMPYFGCFGPGRRCLIRGGLLLWKSSSSARRCCTLRYSFPDGVRKRYKIGDRVAETRRFRRFRDHAQDSYRILGMSFSSSLALSEESCVAYTHGVMGRKSRFFLSWGCFWQQARIAALPTRAFSSLLFIHSYFLPFEERMSQVANTCFW